jgi:hypothetical protein
MTKPLNAMELNELKCFLAERITDNMSTKDLETYVLDDLCEYYYKMDEHEFLNEAHNYWDDMFDEAVESVREFMRFPNFGSGLDITPSQYGNHDE